MGFLRILCTVVLLKTSLFAFDGFYVGGAMGGTILRGEQQGNVTGTLGTPGSIDHFYTQDLQADLFALDWTGMLYAGFGYHWKAAYAALELFGQYSHQRASNNFQNNTTVIANTISENTFDTTQVKVGPWHYGVDLRPGFLLGAQTLLYARVGFERTQLQFQTESANFGFIFGGPFFSFPFDGSHKKLGNFLRLGFGIEQHITPKLSLRTDYIYTDYRKLSLAGSGSGVNSGFTLPVNDSKSVHLRNHNVLVGLSYYFSNCGACESRSYCLPPAFCGWYIGACGGGVLVDGQTKATLSNISNGSLLETHPNEWVRHLAQGTGRGALYCGYGLIHQFTKFPIYTSIEAFGQFSPFTRTQRESQLFSIVPPDTTFTAATTTTTHIRIDDWQYGADFRLGLLPSPWTLVYGSVGTAVAQIHAKIHSIFTNPAPLSLDLALSDHKTRAVLRAGAGIERVLVGKWNLRFDYRFTDYNSLRIKGSVSQSGTANGDISLSVDSKVHPRDHALTIGLSRYL